MFDLLQDTLVQYSENHMGLNKSWKKLKIMMLVDHDNDMLRIKQVNAKVLLLL